VVKFRKFHQKKTIRMKNNYKTIKSQPSLVLTLMMFMMLLVPQTMLNAQNVTITPGDNPNVVLMGDPVSFSITLFASAAVSAGVLEVEVPEGFELLETTPGFIAGSLSPNRRTGRINVPLGANTSTPRTVLVRGLCDAATAAPATDRVVRYRYFLNAAAPAPLASSATATIMNFSDPIMMVTFPDAQIVSINEVRTRVFRIEQTLEFAHINAIQVTATVDTAGFWISQIDVSRDSATWITLPASALTATADGFEYIISRENTFIPLGGYAGNNLGHAEAVFIRETVTLRQCGAGLVSYTFAKGDGADFCEPQASASGSVHYTEPDVVYMPDIWHPVGATVPTSPTDFGFIRIAIANNSNNNLATMHDVFVRHFNVTQRRFHRAWLTDNLGVPIMGPGGATDTIFLRLSAPGTAITEVRFDNLNDSDPALAAILAAAGLSDLNNDGIFDDLLPGARVFYTIAYSLVLSGSTNGTCGSAIILNATSRSDFFYRTFCMENHIAFTRPYTTGSVGPSTNVHLGGVLNTAFTRDISVTPTVNLIPNVTVAQINFNPTSSSTSNSLFPGINLHSPNRVLVNQAVGMNGWAKTSEMWLSIVLPRGLAFVANPAAEFPLSYGGVPTFRLRGALNSITNIWTGGTEIDLANVTILPAAVSSTTGDTIRIHVTPNIATALMSADPRFHIPVICVDPTIEDRTMTFFMDFAWGELGNWDEVTRNRSTCLFPTVPFIGVLPCNAIEITSFDIERQTFGYTDATQTIRVTSADEARMHNFNLRVLSPFDDVHFIGETTVNTGMLLSGSSIWVDVFWTHAQRSMDLIAGDLEAVSLYFNDIPTPIVMPASSVIYSFVGGVQRYRFDIAPAFLNAGFPAFSAGDDIRIVLRLRGTNNMPNAIASISPAMQITTNGEACSPIATTVQIFNTTRGNTTSCSGGVTACHPVLFDHNLTMTVAVLNHGMAWAMGTNALPGGGIVGMNNTWTGGEFRPNADDYSEITVSFPMLVRVNSLTRVVTAGGRGTITSGVVPTSDYTVTHLNGRTIITIHQAEVDRLNLMHTAGSAGIGYTANIDVIHPGIGDLIMPGILNTSFTNFPTSEVPQRVNIVNQNFTSNPNGFLMARAFVHSISAIPAHIAPTGARAEWTLRINNLSTWANTDRVLPHAWLSVEVPVGVTPAELRNASDNSVVPASFVQYAPNRYWIQLGDITTNTDNWVEFILSCTYTACSGTPTLTARFGVSRVDYPTNPLEGWSNYGSPGPMRGISSAQLSFTPPVVRFAARVDHFPNQVNNTNTFCDTLTFEAYFSNALMTEVGDLEVRVDFTSAELSGFSFYSNWVPQVRFGSSGWVNAQSASVANGVLRIILDNNRVLSAFGSSGDADKAWVRFKMRMTCGVENAMQIPMQLLGSSGCGAVQIEHVVTTRQIRIFGLMPPPDYWIEDLMLTIEPMTGGAGASGLMNLRGQYRQAQSAGNGVYAIIDLPPNTVLEEVLMPSINFTQQGRRLTAPLPNNTPIGTVFPFNLMLRPTNIADWTTDTLYAHIRVGMLNDLVCDGLSCQVLEIGSREDSVAIFMEKLEVRLSSEITARSRFGSETTERVEIEGWLVNDGDATAGRLTMDLWFFNGVFYEPVDGVVSGLTVAGVPGNDSIPFRIIADVSHLQDVCNMIVVLRKDNTVVGSLNMFLAESSEVLVGVPVYQITLQPDPICQMAVGTPIGDLPIRDYRYSWTPANFLDRTNVARPLFTYDFENYPIANDTTLIFLKSIIRPSGCVSVDTVFVPLRGLASVQQLRDTTLCSGVPFRIDFEDPTNTSGIPTTFFWTIDGGPNVGLPLSGTRPYIAIDQIRNNTTQPIVVHVSVTPRRNNCDGVTGSFFITVNPRPRINHIVDQNHCAGQIVPAFVLDGNISGSLYRWSHRSGHSIMTATGGTSVIPGFIANNPGSTILTGTYYAFAEFENAGKTCFSDTLEFTISVEPAPIVNTVLDQHLCEGANLNITFTGTSVGSYNWQRVSGASIPGLATSGTGNISVSNIVNPTNNPLVAHYRVIPISPSGQCMGIESSFTITSYPATVLSSPINPPTICSETVFEYLAHSTTQGVLFSWERLPNPNIQEPVTSRLSGVISEVLTNTSNVAQNVQYLFTMTQNGFCQATQTVTVTVNPRPQVTNISAFTICSGDVFSFTPTTNVAAPVSVRWERLDAAGILQAPTEGNNVISETLTNLTTNPVTVTYLIRTEKDGCINEQQLRVTVNPMPELNSSLLPREICSGVAFVYNARSATRGATFTWTHNAPTGITGGATSGTDGNIEETYFNFTQHPIRMTFSITTSANGCVNTETIDLTVNPNVAITSVLTDVICSGNFFNYTIEATTPMAATNFTWVRQANASIAETPSNGVWRDIFERLNNTTGAPVVVNYTLRAEAFGCQSEPTTLAVTVNPQPTVSLVTPPNINMAQNTSEPVEGMTSGTVVSWTSSNPSVATVTGLGGTNLQANVTALSQGIAFITLLVQNTYGCLNEVTFVVNVGEENRASLALAATAASEVCNGGSTTLELTLTGGRAPFRVYYRADATQQPVITGISSSISRFNVTLPVNTGTAPMNVIYRLDSVVDATGQRLTVMPNDVVITVNPTATITNVFLPIEQCEGSMITIPAFTTNITDVSRVTYQWVNTNPGIGLAMSGTGRIASFEGRTAGVTMTGEVTVTAFYRGLVTCEGQSQTFNITVQPRPDFTIVNPSAICAGTSFDLHANENSIVIGAPVGSTIQFFADRGGVSPITAPVSPTQTTTYFVRVTTIEGCVGLMGEVTLTVNPLARLISSRNNVECSGDLFNYRIESDLSGVSFTWSRAAVAGISNAAVTGVSGSTIRETLLNTTNVPLTVEYAIVMEVNGCISMDTVSLTVNPIPRLSNNPMPTTPICSGQTFEFLNPASNVVGSNITWERLDVIGISEPSNSGSGSISEILTNTTPNPVTVSYRFTLDHLGCASSENVQVTVNPIPELSSALYMPSLCSGQPVNYTARSLTRGATFTWERLADAGITPAPSGVVTGGVINETLTNITASPVTVRYRITTSLGTCENVEYVEVVIHPVPVLSSALNLGEICSDDLLTYEITSNTQGVNFTWMRLANNQIVQPPSSGSFMLISEHLTSRSTSPVTVEYRIISEANGCRNMGEIVSVIVNPLPQIVITSPSTPISMAVGNTQEVTATVTGGIASTFTWSSSNTSWATVVPDAIDPSIATITALAEGIVFISLSAENGSGCVNTTTFIVNIGQANVAELNLAPSAWSQICNEGSTILEFSATGGRTPFTVIYTDGTNNFTLPPVHQSVLRFRVYPEANTSNATQTHTFSLVSVTESNGNALQIAGTGVEIEVIPVATVTNAVSVAYCESELVDLPAFATNITDANRVTFNWTNNNPSIGLPTGGTGDIPVFQATNNFSGAITGTVRVTPVYHDLISCPGIPENFTITINPLPRFTVINPAAICLGASFDFSDPANQTAILRGLTPATSAVQFYSDPEGLNPVTVVTPTQTTTYFVRVVTPAVANCAGQIREVVLTVNPLPQLISSRVESVCSGEMFTYTSESNLSNVIFNWTRPSVAGISNAAVSNASGSQIRERLINTTGAPVQVTYQITMTSGGCSQTENLVVTVNPIPVLNNIPANLTICSGQAFIYAAPSSNVSTATINWERLSVNGILEPGTSGSGSINETLTNITHDPVFVTYLFTLSYAGCDRVQEVRVTVNPLPELNTPLDAGRICSGEIFRYSARSQTRGATFAWSRDAVPGITPATGASTDNTGIINEQLINTTATPLQVRYRITTTFQGCSREEFVDLVVHPTPSLSSTLTPGAICSGSPFVYQITSATPGASFIWLRQPNIDIEEAPTHGNIMLISETLTNRSSAPTSVVYTIYTEANGCISAGENVTVIVNTLPIITMNLSPRNLAVTNFHDVTSVVTGGTVQSWVSDNPAVATVTQDVVNENEARIEAIAEGVARITLTAENANGCQSSVTFIVNVGERNTAMLDVALGQPTQVCNMGATRLEVAITGGRAPFTVVYTENGVLMSVNDVHRSIHSFVVTPPANTSDVVMDVLYELVSVIDADGQTVHVVGSGVTVQVLPVAQVMNAPALAGEYCEGILILKDAFVTNITNASGVSYMWTNTNPGIGLPFTGNGDLPAFMARNESFESISGTIRVTPFFTDQITCAGVQESFVITIHPRPEFTVVNPRPVCGGANFDFASRQAQLIQGLAPSTSIVRFYSDFDATNEITVATPTETTIYFARATSLNGCVSPVKPILVDVVQTPQIDPMGDVSVCNDGALNITFTGNMLQATYVWRAVNVNPDFIGLPNNSGRHFITSGRLRNNTNEPQLQTIEVHAEYNAGGLTCVGDTISFTIRLNPTPMLAGSLALPAVCSGEPVLHLLESRTTTANVDITWERSVTNTVLESLGYGTSEIREDGGLTNMTNSIAVVTYRVELTIDGCSNVQTLNMQVLPRPNVSNAVLEDRVCSGSRSSAVRLTSDVWGTQFAWTADASSSDITGFTPSGRGNIPAQTLLNTGQSEGTITYTIVPELQHCTGDTVEFVIQVDPLVRITALSDDVTICSGDSVTLWVEVSGASDRTYQWYRNGRPIPGAQSSEFTITSATENAGDEYFVIVSSSCGTVQSEAIIVRVNLGGRIVVKWDDVILADNILGDIVGYQWYRDGIRIPGATNQWFQEPGGLNGTYKVALTMVDGRTIFTCDTTVMLVQALSVVNLEVSPNPVERGRQVKAVLLDRVDNSLLRGSLYSIQGVRVREFTTHDSEILIDTHSLSPGVYILRIITENGDVYRERIVIQQ